MASQLKDEEEKGRRAALKRLCALTMGASLVPMTFHLLREGASLGRIEVAVSERVPAGRIFLRIQDLNAPTEFRLWVRRVEDGLSDVVDICQVSSRCAEVELTLDLPEARWIPGDYEMRVVAHQSEHAVEVWQSPWVRAFTLRKALWQG